MGSTQLPRPRRTTDYYKLLGVPADATFREIEQAYWRAALANRDELPAINQAYETLGDPERRAEYDAARSDEPAARADEGQAAPSKPQLQSKLRWYLQ
jgi:curved DNA-binding protein CbpA